MHYLPLSLPFFSILVGLFAVMLVLLQLGALRYAYLSIGLSPGGAMLVLFGSLVGSYFNIPLVELPQQHIVAGHVVHYFRLLASLAIACIATVSHLLAHPVRGLGIAVPVFVPAVATAITAWVLSRRHAAALPVSAAASAPWWAPT
jgi:uncharacterized membrane protein